MDLFWELATGGLAESFQSSTRAAGRVDAKSQEVAEHLLHLEERVDKLTLLCKALWTLLQDHAQLTEEALEERVLEIDLMDGQADGKITKRKLANCPKCGKPVAPRRKRCIWCGEAPPADSVFD